MRPRETSNQQDLALEQSINYIMNEYKLKKNRICLIASELAVLNVLTYLAKVSHTKEKRGVK